MKIVTLAAGLAVGYVLGTRAGREKYEQIVSTARKVSNQPSVVQAKDKARELVDTGTEAATAKLESVAQKIDAPADGSAAAPRPARRKRTVTTTPEVVTTTPEVVTEPLV